MQEENVLKLDYIVGPHFWRTSRTPRNGIWLYDVFGALISLTGDGVMERVCPLGSRIVTLIPSCQIRYVLLNLYHLTESTKC
jgi:hypothetical protein